MKLFSSDYFTYKDNVLHCENVSLNSIAEQTGTPVYIYSKKFFTDRFNEFTNAFKDINHTIYFACKSNYNINVMKLFYDLGAGIDVNSAGEFFRAVKAGASPERMLLTGVGKTDEEIELGLQNDVSIIKAESLQEIYVINEIAKKLGKTANIAFRVNPDVDAETHPYISTGLAENKFGIASTQTLDIYKKAAELSNINVTGIDMHIGSQITKISPYINAVERVLNHIENIRKEGIKIDHFDLGGGYGVTYNDEQPLQPAELAENLTPMLKESGCEIMFEPGRFLTANGGVMVTNTLYTKNNEAKNFIVVDGSMTDLLRPSIYGSYHHVQPVEMKETYKDIVADVVGPVCESGDFLAKSREISSVERGDKLAVMSAGAYGMVMSSNYNARRRPAEVIVDGNNFYTVRERETFEHMLYTEEIVKDLHK